MCPKPLRSILAAALVAAFIVSLLPLTFASSAPSNAGQPWQATHVRRGKNGSVADQTTKADTPTPDDRTTESQSEPPVAGPPVSRISNSLTGTGRYNVSAAVAREPQTEDSSNPDSGQTQAPPPKKTPPPFDRPPMNQTPPAKDDSIDQDAPRSTDDSSRPSRPDLRRPPASDSRTPSRSQPSTSRRTDQTDSSDNSEYDRPDRSTGAPPVLHRQGDSRTSSGQAPANSKNGSSENPQRQNPNSPPPDDDDQVVKLESTLVNIPLLVSDRAGRYIPQLSKRDFELYEDGVRQEIANFGSEQVPFSVVLMLDVSPSVEGNVQDIQDAALAFVRQLRPQDRVMVMAFDRSQHYLTDFTSDRRQLESAIRSISVGAGTSVYDAVYDAVSRRLRNVEGRKALILFSDGEDTTSSRASFDDAISIVTESDVLVYGLRYPGSGGGRVRIDPWPRSRIPNIPFPLPWPWPFPRRRGPFTSSNLNPSPYGMNAAPGDPQRRSGRSHGNNGDFMTEITTAGGGPVFDAERVSDMSGLASRIADELRHVYVISYYPTNALSNGGYRAIRVRVKNRDDIAVRHRRGYNARDARASTATH